jgi:outer membrane lipoprotein-sorting protein
MGQFRVERPLPAVALFVGAAVLATALLPAQEVDPEGILKRADEARFPQRDYEVNVTVTSTSPGREPEVRKYQILSKGNDRTLVMTTAPAVDRGQVLLMRERDLFLYMPGISQPIRLPLSQRATGQVANGDLARANFAGDYDAKIARTEEVEGETYWVLELTAAEKGLTYPRLLYWVDQKSSRPLKAEFYSLSGRLLKTCRYEKYVEAGGSRRPSIVTMEDAVNEGAKSVLEYARFRLVDLPEKMFTKDYLKKI